MIAKTIDFCNVPLFYTSRYVWDSQLVGLGSPGKVTSNVLATSRKKNLILYLKMYVRKILYKRKYYFLLKPILLSLNIRNMKIITKKVS